jgi:ectoine hydroxylase-related dioxygenase (phytanoyl-CoA dioxygenase family)
MSFWIALDHVGAGNGAVEYVAGSHRWGKRFQPTAFAGSAEYEREPGVEDVPDIDSQRDQHRLLSWDLAPGDGIAFHGQILHGSPGNASPSARRRAYSIRYCGDDVVFTPRPGASGGIQVGHLQPGESLGGEMTPVVYADFSGVLDHVEQTVGNHPVRYY